MYYQKKICTFVEKRKMKKLLGIVLVCMLTFFFVSLYYYYRWQPLWLQEEPRNYYSINHYQDDTLRILMIGDSWVGMRTDSINKMFQKRLSEIVDRPVILKSKGRGGEKSRGIYRLMFEDGGCGSKQLLSSGVDYCIVFAGINDAAANLGKKQYLYYMKLIMDFLLASNIRPVLIEIPDVNIWNLYGGKPVKDLLADYIKSWMTQCGMYSFSEYRDALQLLLEDSFLKDSVIYVPMRGWNGDGTNMNKSLSLDDQVHLNQQGYIKMDSCIINAIIRDLK